MGCRIVPLGADVNAGQLAGIGRGIVADAVDLYQISSARYSPAQVSPKRKMAPEETKNK